MEKLSFHCICSSVSLIFLYLFFPNTAECPDAWACSSWIGAERLNASEFFWNRHGNIVTNAPWYPGEPDTRECVHLLRSALWDDDFCDIPRHYICEKDIDEV